MNWQDSVIKLNRGGLLSDIEVEYYNRGAEAQAESSFNAVKQEGRKEVADLLATLGQTFQACQCSKCSAIRAKYEDWGL